MTRHPTADWAAQQIVEAGGAAPSRRTLRRGSSSCARVFANWKTTGAALHLPTWNLHLADALLLADLTEEAASVIGDALTTAHHTGDVVVLAELYRLSGRVHLRHMRVPEAEAAFLRACEIARVQEAHLFELRAATELARLWADRGDFDKAVGLLAAIVGRLGEGHTPDIVEASRLLDSLATH